MKKKKRKSIIDIMALKNINQNRNRRNRVIASISLSIIILTVVYTFFVSFDLDSYIKYYIHSDYKMASSSFYNGEYDKKSDIISKHIIDDISNLDDFDSGGALYYNLDIFSVTTNTFKNNDEDSRRNMRSDDYGNIYVDLYGVDKFVLQDLKDNICEGYVDDIKFKNGGYVLQSLDVDNSGSQIDNSDIEIGDKINLIYGGITREFTVMAKIRSNTSVNTASFSLDRMAFYLPSQIYKDFTKNEDIMLFNFNILGDENENFIKNLNDIIYESNIQYVSKYKYIEEFDDFRLMIFIVGITISIIFGIIGVVNFINVVFVSVISRQKELAMLYTIGMTKRQQVIMLIVESKYYMISTVLFSTVISSFISVFGIRYVMSKLWYLTYKFTIFPILIMALCFFIISLIVPIIAYKICMKKNIVEIIKM